MNRILLITVLMLGCVMNAVADHITGGEMFYKFTGMSNGRYEYDVTVRIFMRCNSGRQFNNPTVFSVFYKNTGSRFQDYSVNLNRVEELSQVSDDPCIINPPTVCYEVGYYNFHVSLPGNAAYVIATQVMFRIDGIDNLIPNYDQVGATYAGDIPTDPNNSAHFTGSDLVTVCANNVFKYSFAAEDADGDQLRYSFCNAYRSTGPGGFGGRNEPPPSPPYGSVPYGQGFSGTMPLGPDVTIDPSTGLITGVAPDAGKYVVTVCVEEIRNGQVIAIQRKDLQINITPCSITGAALPPEFMLCGNTMTLSPKNQSTSPLISTYNWEFLDRNGSRLFSSTKPEPSFTFSDSGLYKIRLVINRQQACADSTTSLVRVYPGFVPDFDVTAPCIIRETKFLDETSTSYQADITSWKWEFGDLQNGDDNSTDRNPTYQYRTTGDKEVTLVAENSLGCRDTVTKVVNIYDKPPVGLAFKDTLVCPPDNLQLRASGNGTFLWTSTGQLSNRNISNPFVSPLQTTTYYVDLEDDGCFNRDSVTVRVVDHVTLSLGDDMKACEGDPVEIKSKTDATRFLWTPANTLNSATVRDPIATPVGATTYQLTAFISNCSATESITVTPIPYPVANAGPDTTICFNTHAQLHGTTDGSTFMWTPEFSLQRASTLDPVSVPQSSTTYVLYAFDTKGCDKPGTDTVMVKVQPEIIAFAGNDTSVVVNQPLQMKASGGVIYEWIPSIGLTSNDVADPIAQYAFSPAEGYYTYKVRISNETGCIDSAQVRVAIFNTGPEIYVPNAFTPNNDGNNDYFKVVAPGISKINLFRVYNRWGQLVFDAPPTHSFGWDGSYNGKPLGSDTFVWMVQAVDYLGRKILKRGTVTLIR
ncbi:MAG: gliding motility-associated C-terminal domain-containing protein [Chitinophagaceae bacterium]|nr:gliding motility-associated C-terminal domain-containing protein [Chitinophagaceae bacterium]